MCALIIAKKVIELNSGKTPIFCVIKDYVECHVLCCSMYYHMQTQSPGHLHHAKCTSTSALFNVCHKLQY